MVAMTTNVSAFTTPSSQRSLSTITSTTPKQQQQQPSVVMNEKEEKKSGGSFLGNLFSGNSGSDNETSGGGTSTLRGNKLPPHPSVRPHISPLNRLGPDPQTEPKSDPLPVHPDVRSGTLPNGLPYVILPNKSPPGRFEAHLQVFSGSGKYIFCYFGVCGRLPS